MVTFNRLPLLKEVITALLAVDGPLDKIIVVNNASTDDTHDYLSAEFKEHPLVDEYLLPKNGGGAGGFYHGMKFAYNAGYDFFWLMDDDSMVQPDSLSPLLAGFNDVEETGFICSKVLWTDGAAHKMNIPGIDRTNDNGVAFFSDPGYSNVISGSFVSMLVSREAVKKIGFPYKDFFIWMDDLEYSRRIIRNGFKGLFSEKSVVVHKTANNHNTDIQNCPESDFWKMKYGFRNRTFLHKNFGEYDLMILFFLRNCIRVLYRKNRRIKAWGVVLGSFFKGLSFKPEN